MVRHGDMDPLFAATAEAVEEAIIDALCTAETMTGFNGAKAHALPTDDLEETLRECPSGTRHSANGATCAVLSTRRMAAAERAEPGWYLPSVERIEVDIDKEWLSVADICHYMDVSVFVVTSQLRSGTLPGVKFGREWRVARRDFEDWINAQRFEAAARDRGFDEG